MRVEKVTQIEQTPILDVINESMNEDSSKEGFSSKGEIRDCGSSPVPEDPSQTMIGNRGRGWICYSRNKESDIVKGGAVLVRNKMNISIARIQTRIRRSKWREHCQSFLCWNRYSS